GELTDFPKGALTHHLTGGISATPETTIGAQTMEATKVCPECGKEFTYQSYRGTERKYCSLACQRRATANSHNKRTPARVSNYGHKGYLAKTIIHRYNGHCAICGWRATDELITVKG